MEYKSEEVARTIFDALKKERDSKVNFNVMVIGKTGAGKSTIINNIFSESLAETGIGKPVTQEFREYSKPDFPVSIFDTPGLELGGSNSLETFRKEATSLISERLKSGDISKAIHCIWYCVNTMSKRFEEAEKNFINLFLKETEQYNVPVILVLSQSISKRDAENLKREIGKENMNFVQIIPVLASDYTISADIPPIKAYGLEQLVEVTNAVIPEAVRKTFEAVQKVSLDLKTKRGHAIVAAAAATAAAIGATPIPFADAVALIPEQTAMLAGITAAFGLPIAKSTISAIISATIGTTGTTVFGKNTVSAILKLIPGAGTVVGAVISASTAAALTAALGEAYIKILELVAKGEIKASELETKAGQEIITQMFKERLRVKRNKNGQAE